MRLVECRLLPRSIGDSHDAARRNGGSSQSERLSRRRLTNELEGRMDLGYLKVMAAEPWASTASMLDV